MHTVENTGREAWVPAGTSIRGGCILEEGILKLCHPNTFESKPRTHHPLHPNRQSRHSLELARHLSSPVRLLADTPFGLLAPGF